MIAVWVEHLPVRAPPLSVAALGSLHQICQVVDDYSQDMQIAGAFSLAPPSVSGHMTGTRGCAGSQGGDEA